MKIVTTIVLLIVLNTVTALGVVHNQYQSRVAGIEASRLAHEKDILLGKLSQLLVEYAAWGANSRIERIAIEQLGMKYEYGDFRYVKL